jgi:4-amino-4-deoxy-L-arabinose transferase-like glycosyltransferase
MVTSSMVPPVAASISRRVAVAAVLTVIVWCLLVVALRRTPFITDDWMGWRQADTQAIARNFATIELAPLHPRVDWGGSGPGYVEAELQLYPLLIAVVMRVAGESLWPGQLLSLGFVAAALLVLFRDLARRFGGVPAYLALVCALAVHGVIVIATSIQPDTLSFLFFTLGFLAFLRWLEAPSDRRLLAWVAATAVAGLVKPTTLELGIAQAVLVALRRRELLRSKELWIGWALVITTVGVYLAFARTLYLEHGNTFGILSGGDSKLPAAARLLEPQRWVALARYTVVWGTGLAAVPAAVYLLARRRLGPEEIALAAGALVVGVVGFRYATGSFGTHYHLPHVVLGAFLVARAAADLSASFASRRGLGPALVAGTLVVAPLLFARTLRELRRLPFEPETELGHMLAGVAEPGTLVVVRARAERYNQEWSTPNNFEDPRVFYLSRTKGWVLPNDEPGADRLAALALEGARFYVHVNQYPPDHALAAWLERHATLVAASGVGTVYALRR